MSLEDYIPFNTELPDQFEPDPRPSVQFPCYACKHVDRLPVECRGCSHYNA